MSEFNSTNHRMFVGLVVARCQRGGGAFFVSTA